MVLNYAWNVLIRHTQNNYIFVNNVLEEKQAEAVVTTICDAQESHVKNLITKQDLKESEWATRQEVKDTEKTLRQEIEESQEMLLDKINEVDMRLSLEIKDTRITMYQIESNLKTWFIKISFGMATLILSGMGILLKIMH